MQVYFNNDNQLIFDGHDVGKAVKNLKGSYDYEYYYTIEMEAANKIAVLLGARPDDKTSILNAIKAHFNENDAYSKLGTFMRDNDVDYQRFSC